MLTQHPTHGEHVLHAMRKKATACKDALFLISRAPCPAACCRLSPMHHLQRLALFVDYCKLHAHLCAARCCRLSDCWSQPCQVLPVLASPLAACQRPGPTGTQLNPPLHCLHRYRPSLRHGLEDQALICSFRFTEENRAVREFVVNAVTTSRAVAAWVSRLGLPVNSIQDKLPYHRSAEAEAAVTWVQGASGCVMTCINWSSPMQGD